jgi:uncharacterized protein YuzB (UPF0349 family)
MRKGVTNMNPIVEFCQSNLGAGTESVKKKLEEDAHIDVVEYGCLGFCVDCATYPYALVNGEMVTGKSTKDLLKNIYAAIEKDRAFMEDA